MQAQKEIGARAGFGHGAEVGRLIGLRSARQRPDRRLDRARAGPCRQVGPRRPGAEDEETAGQDCGARADHWRPGATQPPPSRSRRKGLENAVGQTPGAIGLDVEALVGVVRAATRHVGVGKVGQPVAVGVRRRRLRHARLDDDPGVSRRGQHRRQRERQGERPRLRSRGDRTANRALGNVRRDRDLNAVDEDAHLVDGDPGRGCHDHVERGRRPSA